MRATVAEFPYDEGVLGVQVALRLLGCQAIPPWVVSPQAVITIDNVKDFPNPPAFQIVRCMVDSVKETMQTPNVDPPPKLLLQLKGIVKAFAGVQALEGSGF